MVMPVWRLPAVLSVCLILLLPVLPLLALR